MVPASGTGGTHTSTSWLRDLASGQESAVPQRAATKQKNSMPTRSAHLPINLAYSNRGSRSTGQVDCLPESNRGPGSLSTALLRKYSLRNNPGLWDQVLKTKVTLQRSFFSMVSEWWPQAVFLDCCPSRDSAWEHLGEDSKEVFADCLGLARGSFPLKQPMEMQPVQKAGTQLQTRA